MDAHHAEQAIAAAAKSQQRPVPRRPPGTVSSVIAIPRCVQVRRAGQGGELQPTAINFWDTLGLEPAHGPKDVAAFVYIQIVVSWAKLLLILFKTSAWRTKVANLVSTSSVVRRASTRMDWYLIARMEKHRS